MPPSCAIYQVGTARACLLVSYRPLATRSLNAREALEAAPRGDTPSDCLIVADSSPIPQIRT